MRAVLDQFKDRQHRVAADSQYSRLSLTYVWPTWIEMWLNSQFKHAAFHVTFDVIIKIGVIIENQENKNPLFN